MTIRAQYSEVAYTVIEGIPVNVVYVERYLASVRVFLVPPAEGTLVIGLLKQVISNKVRQLKTSSSWYFPPQPTIHILLSLVV